MTTRNNEMHFIGACDRERMEEYLEAIWILLEQGKPIARVNMIAKRLNLSMSSVVEMLKNLHAKDYVTYTIGEGTLLSEKGKTVAKRIVRNHRLIELMMKKSVGISVDEESACGFEHHMSDELADAICKKLHHPTKCLHGQEIPSGRNCPKHAEALKV
jgi:DtxR family Mn-dependent transcriptional regulator